jgi:hypothetical protein
MRGGDSGDEGEKEGYVDIGFGAGKVQDDDKGWEVKMEIHGLEVYDLGQAAGLAARRLMSLAEMSRSPASGIRNVR